MHKKSKECACGCLCACLGKATGIVVLNAGFHGNCKRFMYNTKNVILPGVPNIIMKTFNAVVAMSISFIT